jgi:hypothetical protein
LLRADHRNRRGKRRVPGDPHPLPGPAGRAARTTGEFRRHCRPKISGEAATYRATRPATSINEAAGPDNGPCHSSNGPDDRRNGSSDRASGSADGASPGSATSAISTRWSRMRRVAWRKRADAVCVEHLPELEDEEPEVRAEDRAAKMEALKRAYARLGSATAARRKWGSRDRPPTCG